MVCNVLPRPYMKSIHIEYPCSSLALKTYHFISKDAIDAIFIQRHHPIKTLDLIITQLATGNICSLPFSHPYTIHDHICLTYMLVMM